jgi:outer membrane protein OmpA-like peptidoglycan-associated protein
MSSTHDLDHESGGPWPAFADLLAATTLLFLVLFAAVAVPALEAAGKAGRAKSQLKRIHAVLGDAASAQGVEVSLAGDYVLVSIPGEATFPFNRYELSQLRPSGREILLSLGSFLQQADLLADIDQIQVVGHTSHEGSEERNWVLSASRAATVSLFLIEGVGIPACKVSALGRSRYYPADPVQARSSADIRPDDRRIELEIRPILPEDPAQARRRLACVEVRGSD